jgi:hypothetical protein
MGDLRSPPTADMGIVLYTKPSMLESKPELAAGPGGYVGASSEPTYSLLDRHPSRLTNPCLLVQCLLVPN